MMRRTYGLAAAAALVLAVGSITVAFASSSGRGSTDHRVQVIRLVAKGVQETNADLGKKGFSQGDQELVALNLFRDGKKPAWARTRPSPSSPGEHRGALRAAWQELAGECPHWPDRPP
jgi:hypothetical protein